MNAVADMESFASLFEESLTRKEMRAGELITAQVVRVEQNVVVVNAGLKSESFIPVEEFKDAAGAIEVKAGDFVTVAIESLENGYGETRLSREKAKRLAAWIDLEQAMEEGRIVEGYVSGKVKGGLTAMVNGIRAFLPGSLVDTRPVKDTTPYENKTMELKVIKLDRKRNNVVVSRRAVLEASQGADRESLLENLKEGAIVKGIVKNITDYGAFVDLGGIDGLLHITDLAWRRVKHPSEVLTVGDEVEAKILKFDQEKNRVSLGIKQMGDDPWNGLARRYPQGTRLFGKVTNPGQCSTQPERTADGNPVLFPLRSAGMPRTLRTDSTRPGNSGKTSLPPDGRFPDQNGDRCTGGGSGSDHVAGEARSHLVVGRASNRPQTLGNDRASPRQHRVGPGRACEV